MKFTDKAPIGNIEKNSDGYLITRAKALRTGVQDYLPSELGLIGDGVVRVYRPPESVFNKDSLKSAIHIPVTVDHPNVMVDSDNYNEYAVGEVSTDVLRDGEMVAFSIVVKDKRGIEAIDGGKVEISMGYVADMESVDHPDYDFIMGPPKYNHLAIVDKARAGHQARIGDNAIKWGAAPLNVTDKKEPIMEFVKVMIGDNAVNVAADSANLVADMIKDHKAEIETKDSAIGQLKATLADAESKILDDAAIAALIDAKVKANTNRAKVVDAFGEDAIGDASEAEINGMLKVMDAKPLKNADPVKQVLADGTVKGDVDHWAAFKEGNK